MCNKFKFSHINSYLFIKGRKYYKPTLEIVVVYLVRFISLMLSLLALFYQHKQKDKK
ncbi:hypothetical protein SAMN05421856_102352 [Chryseobacterium taichungense]|uniref:Uncharacterized protein n=1 Tax=Chryseobacterium taichungense TaxID=295069 RepID=A0A1H7XCW0_9FLAO|nr:hypothetical protein SAMN05421856_102352 [Chryseobacterium taichungense]